MITTLAAWAGTALQLVGAFALAERWAAPRTAYWIMLPGALLWLALALLRHDWALALLQASFCWINIRGITRWKGGL